MMPWRFAGRGARVVDHQDIPARGFPAVPQVALVLRELFRRACNENLAGGFPQTPCLGIDRCQRPHQPRLDHVGAHRIGEILAVRGFGFERALRLRGERGSGNQKGNEARGGTKEYLHSRPTGRLS